MKLGDEERNPAIPMSETHDELRAVLCGGNALQNRVGSNPTTAQLLKGGEQEKNAGVRCRKELCTPNGGHTFLGNDPACACGVMERHIYNCVVCGIPHTQTVKR